VWVSTDTRYPHVPNKDRFRPQLYQLVSSFLVNSIIRSLFFFLRPLLEFGLTCLLLGSNGLKATRHDEIYGTSRGKGARNSSPIAWRVQIVIGFTQLVKTFRGLFRKAFQYVSRATKNEELRQGPPLL